MAKVYLVEDCEEAPGFVYAIFASKSDAERFAAMLDEECKVEERTVHYGQPERRGYNK